MKILLRLSLVLVVWSAAVSPVGVSAVASCEDGRTELMSGVCVPTSDETGLSDREPGAVIVTVMNWLMAILGILAILLLVVAGIQYLLAAGDEKKTDNAKNLIKFVIMGVAVALVAYVIVYTIQQLVEGGENADIPY